MATPELLIPQFSLDDHPLVIARKFQEIISEVDAVEGDQIADHALGVLAMVYSRGIPAIAYMFGSESVFVADQPLDSEAEINGGLIYEDADISGNFVGYHYLRTEMLRSICVGTSDVSAFAPEELEAYMIEYPDLPVYIPVNAIKSVSPIYA